ncbi:hypothetical protein Tco_1321149 [Tanacetum coccineum]
MSYSRTNETAEFKLILLELAAYDWNKACLADIKTLMVRLLLIEMCDKKNKVLFTDTEWKGPNWLFNLDYLTDSMNYQPVRSENQANKHAGLKEANHSAEAKNEGEKPTKYTDLKNNEKPVDKEDQAFLDELERLKRHEKETNDALKVPSLCIIDEEVYVSQPPGFVDPKESLKGPDKVVKPFMVTPSSQSLEILKKIDFASVKTASTPIETQKPLVKDEEASNVDSVLGSKFQDIHNKVVNFLAICQFLGRRLISWQCKKQTIMANSTTEAEYVAAANYCGQVLWIQNQMMDYGFNFMNTKIHIDNKSTISVIKNPVAHSRTKNIKIRFHFIRDCYEKRLIEVIKIHIDSNVADLLTKGFDVIRFNFLVVSIGLLNP